MEEKNYKEEYENILKVAKEELLKCKQHKCDQEGNSFAEKEYFIYKMFPLLKGSDMLKDEIIGGLMWQRDQYAKCGSEKSSAVLPGFTVPVNTLIDFLEKSKIVEQDSEDESEKEFKEFNIGPTMDEYEACMLRYLQTAANKKDDEEIIAATKEYKEKLLKLQPEFTDKQKVWSDEIINRAIKEVGLTQYQIEWFKKNVFPPVEKVWSEEDDKIKNELYEFLEEVWYKGTNALDKYGKADCSNWMNWVDTLSDKIKRTTHNKWLEFKEQHIKELKEAEEKGYQDGVKDGMEIELEKQKEQKPNYCHYGGDPNIERCRCCSAACSGRLADEQKPTECLKAERDGWYMCIKDYYRGGKKQCSVGDLVQAKGGMYMMDGEDISEWFRKAYYDEIKTVEWNKATINGEPIPTENHSVDIPLAEWDDVELTFRGEKVKVKRQFFRDDKGRKYSTTEQDEDAAWYALRSWCEKKGVSLYELYPRNEWSEEDENRFDNLCRIIRKAEGWNEVSKNVFITWLKENLFQSKQKWSEEDSMILTEVTSIILDDVNRANSKEEEKHLEYLASKLQSLYSKPKKM